MSIHFCVTKVTGGFGGIGLAIAPALFAAGADLVIADKPPEHDADDKVNRIRRQEQLMKQEALTNAAEAHGRNSHMHFIDTSDASAIENLFAWMLLPFNLQHPLRGAVLLAGTSERVDALEYPLDNFRRILDNNVAGTFLVAQNVAKAFHAKGIEDGSMVIFASVSGSIANKGVHTSAYNASKAALLQLTRSLAAEWGGNALDTRSLSVADSTHTPQPIRVNSISPGYITTNATEPTLRGDPKLRSLWESESMLGRLGRPEELIGPVMFLLSSASSLITGADLKVDGGMTAW